MKIANSRVLAAVAVLSLMGSATAAYADGLYRTAPDICKRLEQQWTGSAENWLNWIIYCS